MKNEYLPSVSIVMPTYNSERTLSLCLESIAAQNYSREKIELIIVDGGSRDRTLEIAREFKATKILRNPLRTGEAGKAVGVREARNEIIALIDSDNILPNKEWLREMTKPFEDDQIVGSETIKFQFVKNDTLINRYCALTGVNDPVCIFVGNYPYFNYITNKWTEVKHVSEERENYMTVRFSKETPAAGANGFLVRRNVLLPILKNSDYLFDVDIFHTIFSDGKNYFAKVYVGIIHNYCNDVSMFIKKQKRRVKDYLFYQKIRNSPLKTNYFSLLKFALSTALLFPIALQTLIGYLHKKDRAWLFHVPACYFTLIIYATESIKSLLRAR
jgi:glycosyltransferase involved in cell wall biosynthesis